MEKNIKSAKERSREKSLKIKSIKKTNNVQSAEVKERLFLAARLDDEELLARYKTSYDGYEEEEVEESRDEFGENVITRRDDETLFSRIVKAFINPFTVVLLVLALIMVVTDVILPKTKGESIDPVGAIIVIGMVFISGLLRFVQETRSGKAAEKLSEMVHTTIAVKRGEQGRIEIPISEVVVGDIVYLTAGDMVPADVRILHAKDLFISQSSLTGESEPVEKFPKPKTEELTNPLDSDNLAFMGSNVISGSAAAIVIAVGDDTVFGSIAQIVQGAKTVTSFEKGVNSVSWVLIKFMFVMVPIVFIVNGIVKSLKGGGTPFMGNAWLEAFMFALAIAVGLTPEMLPMIVSANLAKGAVAMSRKKVIVKDLNSIQNFGAMDVLCTDKTGTLTQDKVTLMQSLDIHGNQDFRVLRHAFLNSFYQTGLKNLMDIAIVEYAEERDLVEEWSGFRKVDEIPFDFERRRMSVVVQKKDKIQLITKGAVEEMLEVSAFVEYKGEVQPITAAIKREIISTVQKYNADGMRVIGIAQKSNPSAVGAFSVADESDMVLMGYLAFLDPPKESSAQAIRALSDLGIKVKILTGDNGEVTRAVCGKVGLNAGIMLLGSDIETMTDDELKVEVERVDVFAKLSPQQKARIVTALRLNNHTVGFMGDGINDSAAMKAADVGISVDTAVDIAKESANIILLEKDLMVLEKGVIEGRKTYANTIKYIKMTASSNFGNMFSVLVASALLPFLPMLPVQILLLNLIYDMSCIMIPWDNVDPDYLKKPRKWDASSISKFMIWIGPTSSFFDITTYAMMFWVICPMAFGGQYKTLTPDDQILFASLFQAGWFIESLWSQTLVIHMIRSPKVPFIESRASKKLSVMTAFGILVGTVLACIPAVWMFMSDVPRDMSASGMHSLPWQYFPILILTILMYMVLVTVIKKVFVKRYGELL